MEMRLVKIGEASRLIGSTPATLRRWESTGELLPARKTRGRTRYYAVTDLLGLAKEEAPTIAYARVSSHDQKADLERQRAALEAYCAAKGWRFDVIVTLALASTTVRRGSGVCWNSFSGAGCDAWY